MDRSKLRLVGCCNSLANSLFAVLRSVYTLLDDGGLYQKNGNYIWHTRRRNKNDPPNDVIHSQGICIAMGFILAHTCSYAFYVGLRFVAQSG